MRLLFSFFMICIYLIGADAKLEIVKDFKATPSILVNKNTQDALVSSIHSILLGDIKVSSNFRVIENTSLATKDINYSANKSKGIDLVATVGISGDNLTLDLYDINSEKLVYKKKYFISQKNKYPFIAHKMAIDINDYVGAPSIEWMNRLVVLSKYVSSSRSDIVIADYTLTYQEIIINDGLNIFPKWADLAQESIYFTKYLDVPTIFLFNLKTKNLKKIVSSEGMAIVSDVSSDYKKILISMSPISQSDIYLFDVGVSKLSRLTTYAGIDVGGKFFNKDKSIAFISDRLGYPNIFSLDVDTKSTMQIVFHGKNNSSVDSNGDYIVYSSRESNNEFGQNVFNIYIISANNSFIRRLTSNGVNQMPVFSKDGESIMFVKNTKKGGALGLIRLRYNTSYLFPMKNIKIQSFDW